MQDHELYRRILGIEAPWYVDSVELKLEVGEIHMAGRSFLAGCLEPLDRQQFKQRRESTGRLRPRQFHHRSLQDAVDFVPTELQR